MTLVAIIFDEEANSFVTLSDVLVSERGVFDTDTDSVPLQYGLSIRTRTLATRIASKISIFGHYALLGAGRVNQILSVTSAMKKRQVSTPEEFRDLVEERASHFKNVIGEDFEASFMIIYSGPESTWYACSPGVKLVRLGSLLIAAAGTGAEEFLDLEGEFAFSLEKFGAPDLVDNRLAKMVNREVCDPDHAWDAFGGAFEIAVSSRNGGFRRISYSIMEISDRDHLSKSLTGYFSPSRHIQCIPFEHGSIFIVTILTKYEEENSPIGKFFLAHEIDATNRLFNLQDKLEIRTEVSFCYFVSQDGFQWTSSVDPILSELKLVVTGDTLASFVHHDSERLTESFKSFRAELYGHLPIADETNSKTLTCPRCSRVVDRLVDVPRERIVETAVSICEECFGLLQLEQ